MKDSKYNNVSYKIKEQNILNSTETTQLTFLSIFQELVCSTLTVFEIHTIKRPGLYNTV